MRRSKELTKNTFILALGDFLPRLGGFVTLPIYTGMLTKTELGRFDLVLVTVSILAVLVTIQIQQAMFRFLIGVRGKHDENIYISNTLVFVFIPSLISSIIFGLTFNSLSLLSRFLLGLFLFLSIQLSVVNQIARGLGKNHVYSIGSIINTLANILLVIWLLGRRNLGFNGLFISLNTALLIEIIYEFLACDTLRKVQLHLLSKTVIKEMLSFSWPLVPNSLSLWVGQTFSKWTILFFLGIQMNAVFAVAGKIPHLFSIANGTLNLAWQESASLAVMDGDKDRYYDRALHSYVRFLTGTLLLLIAATPLLFRVLIKGSYEEAYDQIPILFIGVFFSSIAYFIGSIYLAHKRVKSVGISSTVAAVMSGFLNLVFIKSLGLFAASLSLAVSFFVLALYRAIDINKKGIARIHYQTPQLILCLGLILFSSFLCFLQQDKLNLINAALAVVSFSILNKSLLQTEIGYLRKFIQDHKKN